MSIRASCINPFPKLNWGKMRKAWLSCFKMPWMSCRRKRVRLGKVRRVGVKQTRPCIFVILFTAYICTFHRAATFDHKNKSAIMCYAQGPLQDGRLFFLGLSQQEYVISRQLIINGDAVLNCAGRKSGSHSGDWLWGLPTGETPKKMQWLVNQRTYVSRGHYNWDAGNWCKPPHCAMQSVPRSIKQKWIGWCWHWWRGWCTHRRWKPSLHP